MQKLKALWIAGTKTKITDRDLTPLTRLAPLAMISIGANRHYGHRKCENWN